MRHHKRASNRKGRPTKSGETHSKQKLPRNTAPIELTIDQIGARGDGVGTAIFTHNYETKSWLFFVPNCLVGERVRVQPHSLSHGGIQADLLELITPSPDRVMPSCAVAHQCGGCQFQYMEKNAYARHKETQVKSVLDRADIFVGEWRPMDRSEAHSRRRVRFGLRRTATDLIIGLNERHSNHLVVPEDCITIDSTILSLRSELSHLFAPYISVGITGEIILTKLDRGVDILLVLTGDITSDQMANIGQAASMLADVVRLSLSENGSTAIPLYAPEPPVLSWPNAKITPPAGSFLQASLAGERTLQAAVQEIAKDAVNIVDLFCGSGTLSLPLLANNCQLYVADTTGAALEALRDAADKAGRGGQVTIDARNLFDAPLTAADLSGADLIILDPPRSGARAQITEIAKSGVTVIAYISCNPHSFAKDSITLISAGYQLEWCQPVDQFYLASHVELIAKFSLPPSEI